MKDIFNPRIETDLRRTGRASWSRRRINRISQVDNERSMARALVESLEILLTCPEDVFDYPDLPCQIEYAEILPFPPSPNKGEHVHYIIARMSDNQGYLALNKEHFFYAPTLDGVYEFLKRIVKCPENPNKTKLKYCSTTAP